MIKQRIIKIAILLTIINSMKMEFCKAQSTGFGMGSVVGIGQVNMTAPGLGTVNPKIQYTVGATSMYKFNKMFGVGIDIVGTSKGGFVNGSENAGLPSQTYKFKETYSMIDVEVPVIAQLYLGNDKLSFNALAGAGMNFNIYAASKRVYEDENRNSNYGYSGKGLNNINPTNLSYTFGIGLTAKNGGDYYYVHFRRNGALSPMGTFNGQNAYYGSFNLTFGYLFY